MKIIQLKANTGNKGCGLQHPALCVLRIIYYFYAFKNIKTPIMLSGSSSLYQKRTVFTVIECVLIIGLALVPLFTTFPYRVNIFLSWEGAYRMSIGQMPYKDFGTPLG